MKTPLRLYPDSKTDKTKEVLKPGAAAWYAHERALLCHSIKQRMAYTGKHTLPTYEFRFFDMPRSVGELNLQVTFVRRWIAYWVNKIKIKSESKDLSASLGNAYTLTPSYYKALTKDLSFARYEIERWFRNIGLDFGLYEDLCWNRAYVQRMKANRPS